VFSHRIRYLLQGEKYLLSAYGYAINLWDGTMHWLLYIVMIYGLTKYPKTGPTPRTFRHVYLFWVGSIMFSLFAFLPGASIGAFSHEIKLSSFLNVPYAVIPLYFFNRVLRSDTPTVATPRFSWLRLPVNLFFLVAFVLSILVSFVRYCAAAESQWPVAKSWLTTYEPALTDNTRFFHMQAYVWFLYVVPFYVAAVYCLLFGTGTYNWVLTDLAAAIAGGASQTQFSLLVSVFSHLTPDQYDFPGGADERTWYFIVLGGLLWAVPVLFAIYTTWCGGLYGLFHQQPTAPAKGKSGKSQ
jgi:hypothetical protein